MYHGGVKKRKSNEHVRPCNGDAVTCLFCCVNGLNQEGPCAKTLPSSISRVGTCQLVEPGSVSSFFLTKEHATSESFFMARGTNNERALFFPEANNDWLKILTIT